MPWKTRLFDQRKQMGPPSLSIRADLSDLSPRLAAAASADIILFDGPWSSVKRRKILVQSLSIQAVYENGVLRPEQPLPLAEHQRVQVSIHALAQQPASSDLSDDPVRASYGMLGWKGDSETLERIAMDPEFGVEESP